MELNHRLGVWRCASCGLLWRGSQLRQVWQDGKARFACGDPACLGKVFASAPKSKEELKRV